MSNGYKMTEGLLLWLILGIVTFLIYVESPPYLADVLGGEKFTQKKCGNVTSREIYPIEQKEEEKEQFDNGNPLNPMGFLSGAPGSFGDYALYNSAAPDTTMGPLEIPKTEILNSLQSPPALPETQVRVPKFQGDAVVNSSDGSQPMWKTSTTGPTDAELEEAEKIMKKAQWGGESPGGWDSESKAVDLTQGVYDFGTSTPEPQGMQELKDNARAELDRLLNSVTPTPSPIMIEQDVSDIMNGQTVTLVPSLPYDYVEMTGTPLPIDMSVLDDIYNESVTPEPYF